jgi:hypothetical protein
MCWDFEGRYERSLFDRGAAVDFVMEGGEHPQSVVRVQH